MQPLLKSAAMKAVFPILAFTGERKDHGAHDWNRTNDLLLTKEVLYRLSYVSVERETGIEPALVAWKATVLPLNYSRLSLALN